MKRIILLALLILPQLAYSQFRAKCFCLNSDETDAKTILDVNVNRDTVLAISPKNPIYGLSVTGHTFLGNDNDSYVRIIMKDSYNYEHLVYECFPLLADSRSMQFENIAMETMVLDGVVPQCLQIMVKNATLRLDSYQVAIKRNDTKKAMSSFSTMLKQQNQYIVDKLNENLEKRNMTWRAGVTSVSQMTYEEKKGMFGGEAPFLYGFEYYKGGVFVMPDAETSQGNTYIKSNTSGQYVSEWDWRNRHGKNWMTPVQYQNTCGSCWAFSAVSVLESYINLYYNQSINYKLSEQELVSCDTSNYGCDGGSALRAFRYIKNFGIVDESCFPYTNSQVDCSLKCENPSERVFIENCGAVYPLVNEDSIKKRIFICPISFGFIQWNHIINLIGYKIVNYGDTIHFGDETENHFFKAVVSSPQHDDLIGRTAWLVKNSWGTGWGNNGYGYVICSLSNINVPHYITGRISCSGYSDNDIICEDTDGDGYYFWGIGDKPDHCPSWVPNIPDGDDSNINFGALDSLGYLEELPPGITIRESIVYSSVTTISNRIGIVRNGSLIVTNSTTMQENGNIRVCEGGTLIVDGCTLSNASLDLIPGSTVIIRNNGQIQMAPGKDFNAPKGVVVQIESGIIE